MPEPLKERYSRELLNDLATIIKKHDTTFNTQAFLKGVFNAEWDALELKQRMRHIAQCLHKHLHHPYPKQIAILSKTAPSFNGFLAMIFPDFVEAYGLDDPDTSIPALEWFTQFSSSEFAVRPFMLQDPKRMLKQHLVWAKHTNHHVRRLASEGIRPRLPWAMALPKFKADPQPLIPILTLLRNDPSEYVRRSVANCLNDISKDHPNIVLSLTESWLGKSPETDHLLKHACRGLLKQGDPKALKLFGMNHLSKVAVSAIELSRSKIAMGGTLQFSASIQLKEKTSEKLRIEYRIYYQKSNGSLAPKIFQLTTVNATPKTTVQVNRKHKFADLTTRKHYKGEHAIAIVVNGKEYNKTTFFLS